MSDRQQRVLDAAIEVLGSRGVRQLTHRAVDAEAGLPAGSTSNLFRTRDSLLDALLARVLEREMAAWNELAAAIDPANPDAFAGTVGEFVRTLVTRDRTLTVARHAVLVEVASHPALRSRLAESQRQLANWAAPMLAALGSATPAEHLWMLLSLIDGLLTNQLANPRKDFDPTSTITTLLRGMLPERAGP